MKMSILAALALTTTLLACPKSCCPQSSCANDTKQCGTKSCGSSYRLGSVMETLAYALDIMKMQEKPEIQMAIKGYQMKIASIEYGMDTRAFKEGKFDKALYIKNSFHTKKVDAQVKLFEDIYAVLNTEEKKKLHQLMSAHQVYVQGFREQRRQRCQGGQK